MWIISKKMLSDYGKKYSHLRKPLDELYEVLKAAQWSKFEEVQQTRADASMVKVKSKNQVVVFNIKSHRLIAKFHYNYPRVYILMIMTHAEYDKNTWKEIL